MRRELSIVLLLVASATTTRPIEVVDEASAEVDPRFARRPILWDGGDDRGAFVPQMPMDSMTGGWIQVFVSSEIVVESSSAMLPRRRTRV